MWSRIMGGMIGIESAFCGNERWTNLSICGKYTVARGILVTAEFVELDNIIDV